MRIPPQVKVPILPAEDDLGAKMSQLALCDQAIDEAKKEFDGYQVDGYRHLKDEVLKIELDRIAHAFPATMAQGPEGREAKLNELYGRYRQTERLMSKPEDLAKYLKDLERTRKVLAAQIDKLTRRAQHA